MEPRRCRGVFCRLRSGDGARMLTASRGDQAVRCRGGRNATRSTPRSGIRRSGYARVRRTGRSPRRICRMTATAGHILVIDDDPTVLDVVGRYLARAGYQVSVAHDGELGLKLAAARAPDLVILDLMLPGRSGLEICAELRSRSPVPVIMLTALGEEEDRVVGLELGADDYVTKPFSPRELVLRVGSVLRRSRDSATPATTTPTIVDGNLVVDVSARRAVLDGRDLALTVREFDLLAFLIRHPRQP